MTNIRFQIMFSFAQKRPFFALANVECVNKNTWEAASELWPCDCSAKK